MKMNKENEQYDRMAPTENELLQRLKEYSKIDYGTPAYALSKAEAELILKIIKNLQEDIDWGGF